MMPKFLLLVLPSLLFAACLAGDEQPPHFDESYLMGMRAYTREDWAVATAGMQQAVRDFESYNEASLKCLKLCENQKVKVPVDYYDDQELAVFHEIIARETCIRNCRDKEVDVYPRAGITSYTMDHMKNKNVYDYLQLALFREGKREEAAKACATFVYYNPRHINASVSLVFHKKNKNLTEEDFIPHNKMTYWDLYYMGSELYHRNQWQELVDVIETSLQELPRALQRCRDECYGPLRLGRRMGFAQTVIHQMITLKECQSQCIHKLGELRFDKTEEFFGSYFHYLQYGYHMLNASLPAIQASATQLQLEPHSDVAKKNAVFYRQQHGVTRKDFIPREDVQPLIESMDLEHSFMHVLDELSGHLEQFGEERQGGEEGQDDAELLDNDFFAYPPANMPQAEEWEWQEWNKPEIVRFTTDPDRMLADNVLSQDQCDKLLELTKHCKEGDGYQRKAPHTYNELFEGLNILDAAKKSQEGEVVPELSQLYVNASRRSRDAIAKEFNLQTPLYFSYTHLVCRTAKDVVERRDLSHPVHSDNCILNEATGECDKVPPAYTWRDYRRR
ncbi:Prolyl 3-hydroxylase 1 [Geodia barretti]|uniref:Prolyl 3-hydroxylase 1 n=1 Tax=Geodia barretti TaxID=519541 RepID=A0AA35WMH8_GEOBA|nr:Prolyl 3-hydroxylase 1 [Geodia barretti]